MPHDVRCIANLILDVAQAEDQLVTNLAINKLIYFTHADYLVAKGEPLVDAKIEAWKYGPVIREVYREFSKYGDRPIASRAGKINPKTGEREALQTKMKHNEKHFIIELFKPMLKMSAFQLMEISHEAGGPWDYVYNLHGEVNAGMEITNELIIQFHNKKGRPTNAQ